MDNIFGAGGAAAGGGPGQWFHSLPPVTKVLLASTVIVTALANMGFVGGNCLDFGGMEDVIGLGRNGRPEAWRMLTCFLYAGEFGWSSVMVVHLMAQISIRYETMGPISTRRTHAIPPAPGLVTNHRVRGESSDYAFALLFGMAGILLIHVLLLPRLPYYIIQHQFHRFFHRHLTFYIVYIWSKQHPHQQVNLFGVALSAAYLPWAYVVIGFALNNGKFIPLDTLHGMFVGQIYFYLAHAVPQVMNGRQALIYTPSALIDLCDWMEGRNHLSNESEGNDGPSLVDVDGVIGG